MWKEPRKDGPGCLGDPCASSMTGTDAGAAWMTERRIASEKFGEHLLPLSLYQANLWKMDVEVAAGVEIPRTHGFARRAVWILGDLVPFFILIVLRSEVNGTHELYTPEICVSSFAQRSGNDRRTEMSRWTAAELVWPKHLRLVPMACGGFDGSNGSDGSHGYDGGFDGVDGGCDSFVGTQAD